MKILTKVTVTGAGDSVNPADLWRVAEKFPFVEFGILLGNKVSLGNGSTRFPSKKWLQQLTKESKRRPKIKFSGHLCGAWVDGFMTGHSFDFDGYIANGLGDLFGRFQINTHAEDCDHDDGLYDLLNAISQTVIFQLDNHFGTLIAKEAVKFGHKNIAGLFDLSHGAGVLPESWPDPINGLECGYAGGLSPENVANQLSEIEKHTKSTWIDAESSLFNYGKFDLNRVEEFLIAARPWVIE